MLGHFAAFLAGPPVALAPKKVFVPKHPEVPKLVDYSKVAPTSWWQHWPHLSWQQGMLIKSSINPVKMVAWASKAGHPDMGTVMEIAKDVRMGCDLGTRGEFLCPSVSSSAPSAYEFGDGVMEWWSDGVME